MKPSSFFFWKGVEPEDAGEWRVARVYQVDGGNEKKNSVIFNNLVGFWSQFVI